jgi:hypothetical protein
MKEYLKKMNVKGEKMDEFLKWLMVQLGVGLIKVEESSLEYQGRGFRVVYCHENGDLPLFKGQFMSNSLHPIYKRYQVVPLIIGVKSNKDNEIYIKDNYGEVEMRVEMKAGEDKYFPFFLSTGYQNYYKIKYRMSQFMPIQWIGIEFFEKEYHEMTKEYMKDIVYIRLKEYRYFDKKEGILILNDTLRIEKERIEVYGLKERKKIKRWDMDLHYIYLSSKYKREDIKKELEERVLMNKDT